MNRTVYRIAAALVAATILFASCDLLGGLGEEALNPTQRVNSFITEVSGTQDIAEIKKQFHPLSNTFQVIDEAWWDTTLFDATYQPFTFGPLSGEAEVSAGVVITTTFTSTVRSGALTTFVLAEDPIVVDNWRIMSIDVDGETINSVR